MLAFQSAEDLAGPDHDAVRQPRKLRDMYAIGSVGATRLEPVEENHRVARLPDSHVVVPGMLEPLRQLHQFVVMGREHGLEPTRSCRCSVTAQAMATPS